MSNEFIREAAERNRGAVLPQKHFKLVPGTAHLNQPEMTTFTAQGTFSGIPGVGKYHLMPFTFHQTQVSRCVVCISVNNAQIDHRHEKVQKAYTLKAS